MLHFSAGQGNTATCLQKISTPEQSHPPGCVDVFDTTVLERILPFKHAMCKVKNRYSLVLHKTYFAQVWTYPPTPHRPPMLRPPYCATMASLNTNPGSSVMRPFTKSHVRVTEMCEVLSQHESSFATTEHWCCTIRGAAAPEHPICIKRQCVHINIWYIHVCLSWKEQCSVA